MTVKVYGVAASTCTKRVLTTLLEKNVPYELIYVDWVNLEHKKPEFLKLQPFGKVPVLEDDGVVVFESRAICKYIATRYASQGTNLIPEGGDVKKYALFEQACSIEQNYFNPPAEGIVAEKIFKLQKGGQPDETLVAKYASELDATLAVYDGILAKQNYLAGNEVSLADLFHLSYGKLAQEAGFKQTFDKYPNVKRWLDGLEARDSWAKVGSATL
ncbi:hypothetical protein QQS21_008743 [Conoideocrella luteorostrata]|uniref:glutathione transferase n=1 Tax=Conoideocrella luteorostrata TaxID=1105319 RepID=A0AAJ0CKN6_9HYPO|nr:hypothetical protein QQS21_008743 [Conoideocrella luteorostrata]